MSTSEKEKFYAKDRQSWRKWLEYNHKTQKGVWLIYDKKIDGKRNLTNDDIVEEAICFGWIDSLPKSLSAKQAMIYVSLRKPKSNWSEANRERAEKMIGLKKIRSAGMEMIKLAKQTGTWTALVQVQSLIVPADLQKELNKNKRALTNFSNFPPSSKRIILEWILSAKKPETRKKRIDETVSLAHKNIKANHYRQ